MADEADDSYDEDNADLGPAPYTCWQCANTIDRKYGRCEACQVEEPLLKEIKALKAERDSLKAERDDLAAQLKKVERTHRGARWAPAVTKRREWRRTK